jgi:hypothetical protein
MSELKVNKISPRSGTDITLGDSGDTFTIPSGATITNSGTATGFGGTNTPAFYAYNNTTQTGLSNDTDTKLQANTEEYDIGGCYNNTGSTVTLNGISTPSYSFAPNVAGKYMLFGRVEILGAAANDLREGAMTSYFGAYKIIE